MKVLFLLWLTLCFIPASFAGGKLGSAYVSGQTFAAGRLQGAQEACSHVDKENIPGFSGDEHSVSGLDASSIGDAALEEVSRNPGGIMVREAAGMRKNYVIDAKADPLVVAANKATAAPLETINEEIDVVMQEEEQKDYIEICDEGKGEVLRTCSKVLHVTVTIYPEHKVQRKRCPGHKTMQFDIGFAKKVKKRWTCGGCETYYETIPERYTSSEQWIDGCQALESAVDEGTCSYEAMHHSTTGETRIINGKPITKDHFEEHYTYRCFKPTDEKCERLREMGCVQIDSECKEKEGDHCLVWEQTYSCRTASIVWQSYKSRGSIFCLSGDCHPIAYGPNTEFLNAISHLSIFKEAQADIRASIGIFGGKDRRCSRNCLNFRDCCGNGKGWGVSLHLTECAPDELELSDLRKAKKCVHIGTFCAEKHLTVCTRKQTSFCCFGTKLSRLIQEQAHAQLGLGWGTPEKPECQGLTAEQLSLLDFSKMDLTELYSDIQATMKAKTPADIAPIAERLQRNVSNMTLKSSQARAVAGREPM
ncbi:MAG: conjugal transfer protein TraN [Alphaproteobacteria bacterium]